MPRHYNHLNESVNHNNLYKASCELVNYLEKSCDGDVDSIKRHVDSIMRQIQRAAILHQIQRATILQLDKAASELVNYLEKSCDGDVDSIMRQIQRATILQLDSHRIMHKIYDLDYVASVAYLRTEDKVAVKLARKYAECIYNVIDEVAYKLASTYHDDY